MIDKWDREDRDTKLKQENKNAETVLLSREPGNPRQIAVKTVSFPGSYGAVKQKTYVLLRIYSVFVYI